MVVTGVNSVTKLSSRKMTTKLVGPLSLQCFSPSPSPQATPLPHPRKNICFLAEKKSRQLMLAEQESQSSTLEWLEQPNMRIHFATVPSTPPPHYQSTFYSSTLNSFRRNWSLPVAPENQMFPPSQNKILRPLPTGDK